MTSSALFEGKADVELAMVDVKAMATKDIREFMTIFFMLRLFSTSLFFQNLIEIWSKRIGYGAGKSNEKTHLDMSQDGGRMSAIDM